MINCTHCGTQNREGSKFCGNCGARLTPPSGLICPMCGTPNKLESVFCLSCGARLAPLTTAPPSEKSQPIAPPIKGLSLPARESPGELPAEFKKIEDASGLAGSNEKKADSSWLDKLRATPLSDEAPAEEEQEDVPAWLKSVEPQSETKPHSAAETVPTSEIPDWLQKIRPVEEPAAEIVDEGTIPDWLRTPSQEKETPIIEEPPSAEQEPQVEAPVEPEPRIDTPIAEESQVEPPITQEAQVEIPEAQVPQIETPVESETAQPPIHETVPTPVGEEEIPAWLQELKPEEAETHEPVASVETSVAEELLESLEAKTLEETPVEEIAKPAWAMQPSSVSSTESEEDIPDWLRTLPSGSEIGAEPSELLPGAEAIPEIQPALPAEVPNWLASLKPATQSLEEDLTESTGPLEGLRGILPIAIAMTEPHPAVKLTQPIVKSESGQLFESILAAPRVETTTPVVASQRRVWTMRPLIYLIIALAALLPFFIPSDWAGASLPISKTPAAEFYDIIQALPANSTVLVSFDYDPSQSGEMDLQANAILRHLIQRRVKMITVSTLETGAPMAKRILDSVTQNASGYAYGGNYVNLGFLPGHEAALSQLVTEGFSPNLRDFAKSQALTTYSGFSGVKTLRDVALIIDLVGSEDGLRMWMEQVQPRTSVKIVAGVSAGVEPKAQVYRSTPSKQLAAMVSGLVGAAQYEILANQPGVALGSINAQSAAQLALVLMVIVGNIVFLISRGRKQNA